MFFPVTQEEKSRAVDLLRDLALADVLADHYARAIAIVLQELVLLLDGCVVTPQSSWMCKRGTKGCNINHRSKLHGTEESRSESSSVTGDSKESGGNHEEKPAAEKAAGEDGYFYPDLFDPRAPASQESDQKDGKEEH